MAMASSMHIRSIVASGGQCEWFYQSSRIGPCHRTSDSQGIQAKCCHTVRATTPDCQYRRTSHRIRTKLPLHPPHLQQHACTRFTSNCQHIKLAHELTLTHVRDRKHHHHSQDCATPSKLHLFEPSSEFAGATSNLVVQIFQLNTKWFLSFSYSILYSPSSDYLKDKVRVLGMHSLTDSPPHEQSCSVSPIWVRVKGGRRAVSQTIDVLLR